jgi:hypothetical protein
MNIRNWTPLAFPMGRPQTDNGTWVAFSGVLGPIRRPRD